jgi:hypothetical protein
LLLTSGIIDLALGHFEIEVAAVLLRAPSVMMGGTAPSATQR